MFASSLSSDFQTVTSSLSVFLVDGAGPIGYEAAIVRALGGFFRTGAVYKGKKPVHWCTSCRTALAEAEVEYENHTSPSVWVKYRMQSDPRLVDEELGSHRVAGKPVAAPAEKKRSGFFGWFSRK